MEHCGSTADNLRVLYSFHNFIIFRDVSAAEKALGKTTTIRNEISAREKDFNDVKLLGDKLGDVDTLRQVENLCKIKAKLNNHLQGQETSLNIGNVFINLL